MTIFDSLILINWIVSRWTVNVEKITAIKANMECEHNDCNYLGALDGDPTPYTRLDAAQHTRIYDALNLVNRSSVDITLPFNQLVSELSRQAR